MQSLCIADADQATAIAKAEQIIGAQQKHVWIVKPVVSLYYEGNGVQTAYGGHPAPFMVEKSGAAGQNFYVVMAVYG